MAKSVVLLSGGLDSTTLAYTLRDRGDDLYCLAFNYGQRHERELVSAQKVAELLGAEFAVCNLQVPGLVGNALTDDSIDIPEGHYASPNMALTVVPNRNAMMLSIAFGIAAAQAAYQVAAAFHAGDHPIYPDCRVEFKEAFEAMEKVSLEGVADVGLYTPFINVGKDEIVRIGTGLKVPYGETWSCYKGGEVHCGYCGTCYERKEAFSLAKVDDPTLYGNNERVLV